MKNIVMALLLLSYTFLYAEVKQSKENWKFIGNSNVTATGNTYSDNWTGGENSFISWSAKADVTAKKQLSSIINNENVLKLEFGQTVTQTADSSGEKMWNTPEKSTDLVDFESVCRFTLEKNIDPIIGVRLTSQFLDVSDINNKLYINPMEITESFGAIADITKNEQTLWNLRFGGAVRQLYNRRNNNSELNNDGGLEFISSYKQTGKNGVLSISSLLKIYEALFSSVADKTKGLSNENDWKFPDINWENAVVVNVYKYLMLNLSLQLLYDKEINKNMRIKETASVGLTYSFGNK